MNSAQLLSLHHSKFCQDYNRVNNILKIYFILIHIVTKYKYNKAKVYLHVFTEFIQY